LILAEHFQLRKQSALGRNLLERPEQNATLRICPEIFLRDEPRLNVLSGMIFLERETIDRGKSCKTMSTRIKARQLAR
jgi:hypothetical protein